MVTGLPAHHFSTEKLLLVPRPATEAVVTDAQEKAYEVYEQDKAHCYGHRQQRRFHITHNHIAEWFDLKAEI